MARALAGWTGDALRSLLDRELGGIEALEGSALRNASGFEVTSVLLAGSLPSPTLLGLLAPLLLRSPVLAKTSAHDPVTAGLVADSVAAADPELGACIEIVSFRRKRSRVRRRPARRRLRGGQRLRPDHRQRGGAGAAAAKTGQLRPPALGGSSRRRSARRLGRAPRGGRRPLGSARLPVTAGGLRGGSRSRRSGGVRRRAGGSTRRSRGALAPRPDLSASLGGHQTGTRRGRDARRRRRAGAPPPGRRKQLDGGGRGRLPDQAGPAASLRPGPPGRGSSPAWWRP